MRENASMKFTEVLLGLTLLIPVGFVACAPQNEALARATAAHPEGRQVFEQYNCIRCHEGGTGGYGKKMIENERLKDLAYIKERIVNGKNLGAAQMPAYPDIPKKDLEEVSRFVQALAGWEP
jgi:mono/diheme cytochrome c family protein